jgi:hypothetical protein
MKHYITKNKLSGQINSRSYERRCKWKNCRKNFLGTKNQEFCSKKCMYEWRKDKNWETLICSVCNGEFRERKNYRKNGKKRMFCSNECNRSSDYKKEKLREWGLSDANPRKSQAVKDKIKQTKLERYGDENYNNPEQTMKTTLERYGVPAGYMINPSNGKRISEGQRELYNEIKKKHKDALLEHWLPDMQKSVDIFIPSQNKIVEYYGRYWHADPNKYSPDYYHTIIKKTAKEIWERDKKREQELIDAGYKLQIEWEKGR